MGTTEPKPLLESSIRGGQDPRPSLDLQLDYSLEQGNPVLIDAPKHKICPH